MEGINNQSAFTEQEAINITMEHGYKGNEFETAIWKSNGCLKTDRTLTGLIEKLKTIYHHVEVTGKGKKRKYILKDKKDDITARPNNYKGTIASQEDLLMTEYIFNRLLYYNNQVDLSYKGWAEKIGFINPDTLDTETMINIIKDFHRESGFYMLYNPKEVVSNFIQTLRTRNRNIIEHSFSRLEKDNRIKVITTHRAKYTTGKYSILEQWEYEEIQEYIDTLLALRQISPHAYVNAKSSLHKSNKMKQAIKEINKHLEEEYNIDFVFKTFKVEILNNDIKQNITKENFTNTYFSRLIQLAENRQQKEKKVKSISFWERYELMNIITLLDYLHVNVSKELYEQEYNRYINDFYNYWKVLEEKKESQMAFLIK